jgi:uncharacterized protein (TIRG00374 family)
MLFQHLFSMSPRRKKALVLLLKIAVLLGVAEYARRQAQVADAVAVLAPDGVALTSAAGATVFFPEHTKLAVKGRTTDPRGAPQVFQVGSKNGATFEIPAADVQGAVPGGSAEGRFTFTLLPGVGTVLARLDWQWLILAFALFGPPIFLMAVRWQILLLATGVNVPFFTLVRLHFLGFFYNTFMPGGVGGDVIKTVYLVRQSSQKAEAATTVVTDRVVGLFGLLIMAGVVVLVQYRIMHSLALPIGAVCLSASAGFALYFSPGFRRLIRYDALLARLPRADVLGRIDAALYGLRKKKASLAMALGLTIALQFLEVIAVSFAGRSLGLHRARLSHYLAFVPIGFVINSLPISFGGVGLMEGAFLTLFRDAGVATATEGFMLGVITRLLIVGWGLLGVFSALFPPQPGDEAASSPTPAESPALGATPPAHAERSSP